MRARNGSLRHDGQGYVILDGRDRLIPVEDHAHRVSVAGRFLLILASERSFRRPGRSFSTSASLSLAPFDARGRFDAFKGGDLSQARQFFRGECLDDGPATLKLVDFGNKVNSFWDDLGCSRLRTCRISIFTRLQPIHTQYPFANCNTLAQGAGAQVRA